MPQTVPNDRKGFELTSDSKIILPLVIGSIIVTRLATRSQMASINPLKLLRRGVGIRNRFGVGRLLIKRMGYEGEQIVDGLPDADFVFEEGEVMLVPGPEDQTNRFERNG